MTPRSSCPGGESTPLQGANLRLNYEINNVTDTALGNLARGKPSFCRSDRCLSYRPPGSLLESRGGSILARAEEEELQVPQNSNVVRDQIICFPRLKREGEEPVLFRRVEIWDAEKQEAIVF